MKKYFLILTMMLTAVSGAWADDSGSCGTAVTWSYVESTQTLTISGSGAMTDYNLNNQPWKDLKSQITTVTIESGVTSIGDYAFYNCTNLASVTVYATTPPSLRPRAFFQNASGRKIYVPSISVDTYKAADNWSAYADAIEAIPAVYHGNCGTTGHEPDVTWEIIGTSPNYTLIISGTGAMTNYENSTDQPWKDYRDQITTLVIGDGVTTIGKYAFTYCEKLASVAIPASLTSIGDYAFFSSNLTSISLPAGFTTIGKQAFYLCANLSTINVADGNAKFSSEDGVLFNNNKTTLILYPAAKTGDSYSIPNSVTTIGNAAFMSCSTLKSITVPTTVTTISADAFNYCSNVATITLNSSPQIGNYAFNNLKSGAVVAINAPANEANSYQWATFYNQKYAFQADANTQVFKVTLAGSTVTLLEVEDKIVNAGTPVVLKSTGTPVMTLTTASSSDTQGNDLVGTSVTKINPGNAYVLNNGTDGVGFYQLSSTGTIEFGKAYLVAMAGAREFLGFGETTDISEKIKDKSEKSGEGSDVIYDIHGRRVNGKPSKGLYIINGKKVVMK